LEQLNRIYVRKVNEHEAPSFPIIIGSKQKKPTLSQLF
jgi:hypothetical protein